MNKGFLKSALELSDVLEMLQDKKKLSRPYAIRAVFIETATL
jgi:hypothetical protein